MKINYGAGTQQLGSTISQIGSGFMQISAQKAQMNQEALNKKYTADSGMAEIEMKKFATTWMQDPANLSPSEGVEAVAQRFQTDFDSYFDENSGTLFNDPRHAEEFKNSTGALLSGSYGIKALEAAHEVYTQQTVAQANRAIDTLTSEPSEDIGGTKKKVMQQLATINSTVGLVDPDAAVKAAMEKIDSTHVTQAVNTLVTKNMPENEIFSYINGMTTGKFSGDYADQASGLFNSLEGPIAKETAQVLKDAVVKAKDSQFEGTLANVQTSVAKAVDAGGMFDTREIDKLIQSSPVRHQLKLYKEKNTANSNNDGIIVDDLTSVINQGGDFTSSQWKLVGSLNDPAKSDSLATKMMVSKGQSAIASGKSLIEAVSWVNSFAGPVSATSKMDAKAQIVKTYLDGSSDVAKVAKDLLTTVGYDPGTEEGNTTDIAVPQISLGIMGGVTPIEAGNIDIASRPTVQNDDGSVSTVRSISIEEDGKEVLIPTVVEGKVVSDEEAISYYQITGQNLGRFKNAEEADKYAVALHNAEEQRVASVSDEEAEPVPEETVDNQVDESSVPKQSDWIPAYEAKVKERRDERKKVLTEQKEKVQKEAGISFLDEPESTRPSLNSTLSQEVLLSNMLQIVKDGDGKYITAKELALIKSDETRKTVTGVAAISDSMVVDSPAALSLIDMLRRDPNVMGSTLVSMTRAFVNNGDIKAETVEKGGLTKSYSFAENPNKAELDKVVSDAMELAYPTSQGVVVNGKRSELTRILNPILDNAITMNPDLLGEDFPILRKQIKQFTAASMVNGVISNLGNVAKYLSKGDMSKRIDNLERGDVSAFMKDQKNGGYDLLMDYDLVSSNAMRSSRHDSKEMIMDKVAKAMTPYKDYEDLEENGTQFEKARVLANASFILAGGALENSLTGSFGIKARDMKLMGKQWAFSDSADTGLYFIATDTDLENRGSLGWGMATADSDGVSNMVMFKDYVDPQLSYDIQDLQNQIDSPLFKDAKKIADDNKNISPLGMGGLGFSPVRVQAELDKKYYGVIEEHKKKEEELSALISDIMTYRYNLLGMNATSLPTRL